MAPNPNFYCANAASVVPVEEVDVPKDEDYEEDAYVCTLSADLADFAKRELGETAEVRDGSLSDLRQWLRSRPELSRCRRDAVFLLRFLRSQKFRQDKTRVVLESYLRMRRDNPDWFCNLDPSAPVVSEMTDSGLSLVLPGRDPAGRRVLLSYAAKVDVARHTNADIMRATMASVETLMEDEENQIRGVAYIFYCKGLCFSHCTSIWTPSDAARLFGACEKNLAVRHSDINLVRLPFTMWAVVEFVKQFLSSKIKGRINVLSDEKKLAKKVGAAILPQELGGDSKMSMEDMGRAWRAALMANKARLLALDHMVFVDCEDEEVTEASSSTATVSSGLWSYIPGM